MKFFKISFARCARALSGDRKGVTALEYGLIAALIAGVIIASVKSIGTNLNTQFDKIAQNIPAS
ncbi:Flp family type IVb pilin [Acetobacter sp. LMG 32666]|uniref:Flp family type IVb pilin n=1 Tax=Acetobacter sp. LMG 32666 TaxID=2959295 RepID=UPI0030C8CA63